LYLKTGKGFHSNDTRVLISEESRDILPAAYGFDFGYIWKPTPKMFLNMAYWYLYLEQEFVYVGDAGIVEPSGRTRRMGVDLGFRWQISKNLFANVDANYAMPRSLDDPEGENLIPLAPTFTSTGGLNFKKNGFNAALSYRWLKDRPANEDNSIVAKGYMITDLNFGYEWKRIGVGIAIENLLNEEWNETQFATESRLDFEPVSVEEIHFTPGTPFFIKGNVSYKF
jgi:outer membrane receptor protein involved in Fe transport